MKKPKLSVIIPAYNCEETIERAISSIINQTYKGFIEILVVNDGSKDKTKIIVENFKFRAKNNNSQREVVLINKNNEGVSSARNVGISVASGDFIIFLDADDYYFPESFERYMQKQNNADYLISCIEQEIETQIITQNMRNASFWELLNSSILNSPCAKVYSRQLIEHNGFKFDAELSIGEDLNFNLQCYFSAEKVAILNYKGYFYDTSQSNLTVNYRKGYFEERLKALHAFKKICQNQELNFANEAWFVIKLSYSSIFLYLSAKEKKSFKEKCEFIKNIKNNKEVKKSFKKFNEKSLQKKILKNALYITPPFLFIIFLKTVPIFKKIFTKRIKEVSI